MSVSCGEVSFWEATNRCFLGCLFDFVVVCVFLLGGETISNQSCYGSCLSIPAVLLTLQCLVFPSFLSCYYSSAVYYFLWPPGWNRFSLQSEGFLQVSSIQQASLSQIPLAYFYHGKFLFFLQL